MKKILISVATVIFLAGCSTTSKEYPVINLQESTYRRLPYANDGDHRVIGIFYATSRKAEKRHGELHFTSKLGKTTTTGMLKAKIDPRLKIGKMLPKRMKRKGIIGVQDVSELDHKVFMEKLSEAIEKSPHKSLLVLVHGFKDDFEMTATKLVYFSYLLDVNTPVLMFDWPGDQSVSPMGYKKAEKLAAESGPYLGKLLTDIIREVKPDKLWVGSASLGCQVVSDAFEWMYQQSDLVDPETEIAHVLMSAPDVGKDEFDNKFKDEIAALTKKLTVYVSSDDKALLVSQIIDREKKFGRQKINPEEHAQYDEAKHLLELKPLDPDRITIIDVTPINHASFHHGYDLEAPEYYDDFFMRVLEVSPHDNRRLYLVKVKENVDYWIMRGDG
jgi:esterase/lipase superfamily enzyme